MEKVGMYRGKFLPLHLGHLYCIDVASKQCDKVYVILFANSEEDFISLNSPDLIFDKKLLSPESRFECLKNVCKQYDNVIPIMIDATECKHEDGSEDWEAEAVLVRNYIPNMYKVFSSEERYGEYFKVLYPEATHVLVDTKRIKYPISSTRIRTDKDLENRQEWLVGGKNESTVIKN